MKVSKSGFYKWVANRLTRKGENILLEEAIIKVHSSSNGRYGWRSILGIIKKTYPSVGRKKVIKIMNKFQLHSSVKSKFKKTTQVSKQARHCSDLVLGHFRAYGPDELWTSDITYIKTKEGWLYLCIILDTFSRRIVGWSLQESMKKELVLTALNAAFINRNGFKKGIIFHSDKGSQYSSNEVKKYLLLNGFHQSMSTSCYDNSITETFFATLKKELIYQRNLFTKQEAKCEIVAFIEAYYNRVRVHSALGYLAPIEYERAYGS